MDCVLQLHLGILHIGTEEPVDLLVKVCCVFDSLQARCLHARDGQDWIKLNLVSVLILLEPHASDVLGNVCIFDVLITRFDLVRCEQLVLIDVHLLKVARVCDWCQLSFIARTVYAWVRESVPDVYCEPIGQQSKGDDGADTTNRCLIAALALVA